MMLFGEKYLECVRMVFIGDFFKELCGGMYVFNICEIERIEIFGEEFVFVGI